MTDEVRGNAPDQPADELAFNERGIAEVGSPNRQTNILIVVFSIAIVGMLLWFVNRSDEAVATARLTDPQALEFEAVLPIFAFAIFKTPGGILLLVGWRYLERRGVFGKHRMMSSAKRSISSFF